MDMIQSMTGFGKGNAADGENEIRIELKTLNNRYLDINTRIPKDLSFLEEAIRSQVKRQIRRGRVELYLTYEQREGASAQVTVDHGLMTQYMRAFAEMKERYGIETDITASAMVKLPDVIQLKRNEADEEAIGALAIEALTGAIDGLTQMRIREGENLAADIGERAATLLGMLEKIKERSPVVVTEYQEKLANRIQELCKDTAVLDETRLESEVAYMVDRCDIAEEITRLESHLSEIGTLLKTTGTVGRKLDFLIQEINREINTIGSKSSDLVITRLVVDMKSEAERIREQVQNIQ
jgi:uncharacterized protein (TIGR00255 family)